MGGKCDIVRPQALCGKGYLQKSLHRVGVEQGRPVFQSGSNLRHRKNRPRLVVHQHDADQRRILPDGVQHGLRRNASLSVRFHAVSGITLPLQLLYTLEYGAVFHCRGDDMLSYPAVLMQGGPDSPVVALSAAGCEKQLLRPGPQGSGNGSPGPVRQGLGLPSQSVLGGGVAVSFRQSFHHRLSNFGRHRCGGGVV